MQNRDKLKSVECAVAHKCAKNGDKTKRCAQCEIGYAFVVCDPRTLECGHLICFECKSKVEEGNLNCKICATNTKYTEAKGAAAETLIDLFLNDLTKELYDKYQEALNIYNGI
jgi:hypothetical protein